MRHLTTLALAGLFGTLLLAGDASACHKMKKCATPTVACAPAPVCAPAPAPVCAPKKTCHFKMPKMPKMTLCHKKAACAPMAYETYAPAAPMATPQASGQGM